MEKALSIKPHGHFVVQKFNQYSESAERESQQTDRMENALNDAES